MDKKILKSFFLSVFLFAIMSCDNNNNGKTEEDNLKNKEDKITRNQDDAKLFVTATENYIRLINYNNYLKTKDSLTVETKFFLQSLNNEIQNRLSNLKKVSKEELILLPSKDEVLFLDKVDSIDKSEKDYLIKLDEMLDKQLSVMENLTKKSNNIKMNVLANETEDFLKAQKENVKKIISKR
ncbi:hypothetical protein [Polaribacter aestuariivivens]|uniref:hypothetical protein n=1 Tax=Polaribacter aestuariivivens TaxID=2304626 RepID=UPI003F496905